MKLRRLTKADILKASGIVKANYSEFYGKKSKAEMADAFGKGAIRPRYLVAEEKGKIIGLTGYMQSWIDYNAYEIFWVNVSPKHQGKGIGTMLVKGAIAEIKKRKGAKFVMLTAARPSFYKRFNFKTVLKYGKKGNLMALKLG